MKCKLKISILIVSFSSYFFINGAVAFVLPADRPLEQKEEWLEAAKKVVKGLENSENFASQKSPSVSLMNSAFAFPANSNCFYGGWPSLIDEDGFCKNPAQSNSDYQNKCSEKTDLYCNPVFFGEGICVANKTHDQRINSYKQCEEKFEDQGGSYHYIQAFNDTQKSSLAATLKLIDSVCSSEKKQISSLCKRLKQKETELEKSPKKAPIIASKPKPTEEKKTTPVADCKKDPTQPLPSVVKNLLSKSEQQVYDALKKQFEQSPMCHTEDSLTQDQKIAAALEAWTAKLQRCAEGYEYATCVEISKNFTHDQAALDSFKNQLAITGKEQSAVDQLLAAAKTAFKNDPALLAASLAKAKEENLLDHCQFVNPTAFQKAYKSYQSLKEDQKAKKTNLLTVVDLTLPFNSRRLFVFDLDQNKTLFNTWVATGDGKVNGKYPNGKPASDGSNPPVSNKVGSDATPDGTFVTGGTPQTDLASAFTLKGVDKNNSNTDQRKIYFHQEGMDIPDQRFTDALFKAPDPFPNPTFDQLKKASPVQYVGYIPYTFGCIGVPPVPSSPFIAANADGKPLDEEIKKTLAGGSTVFVYSGKETEDSGGI